MHSVEDRKLHTNVGMGFQKELGPTSFSFLSKLQFKTRIIPTIDFKTSFNNFFPRWHIMRPTYLFLINYLSFLIVMRVVIDDNARGGVDDFSVNTIIFVPRNWYW